MNNPWSEMSDSPPYILKNDSREIEVFNKKYQRTDYTIHPELIPEPPCTAKPAGLFKIKKL